MPDLPSHNIDDIDRRILAELQNDGRMTNQDLSERVGLSPSPCLRRLRTLETTGRIFRYVALVDPNAVGLTVTAFVRIRLDQQDDRHLALFEEAVAGFPEVMECYLMTGDADYQLRILVRSLGAFEDFLRQKLTRIEGVSQVTTSFALRPVVYKTSIPI
ncbi:Lrp/AsnC family leucine-responsive transcriptional regulator [Sphingobium xenophagum]|uniref:Lrp/AsnC family leucine-responsive transcriptional regulator n=1 Tax=Sphingobium xenophagum TaxID=121428 RepID=A0ABU1WZG2_SPHXE|nr:Lrp/AsnC family transcriptional regulator [Sphingobium xenophagum]MDR7154342.1 Lrp/AsnC family leucine-responsive transcriptional regulator [Sphingobium xenophagum]